EAGGRGAPGARRDPRAGPLWLRCLAGVHKPWRNAPSVVGWAHPARSDPPGSRRAPVRAWSQRPRRRGAHTMRIGRRTFATLGPLAALGLLAACSDDGGGGGGGGGEGDFVTDL